MTDLEQRIVICAPTGRDAEVAAAALTANSFLAHAVPSISEAVRAVQIGAGVLIVAVEALDDQARESLVSMIRHQEPWSDIPIVVLAFGDRDTERHGDVLSHLGNVIVLDRPLRVRALTTTVAAALRARARQYEVREHLLQQAHQSAALAESEQRYRLLAELGPDPLLVERGGVIQYANVAAAACLKREVGCLVGRPRQEFVVGEALVRPQPGASERAHEEVWRRADGTEINVELALSDVYWDGDQAVQVVARDITARKAAEDGLRAASNAKDEFLGLVSHELRTPLTVISGVANALKRRQHILAGDDDAVDVVALLSQNADRLTSVIDNMLSLARISKEEIATEPVLVRVAIATAVARHRLRFPQRELRVHVGPEIVEANGASVDQVLENLLSNAEKYSPPESVIEILSATDGRVVSISVLDEGEGIATDELEFFFDSFFRSRRRSADQKPGAGLGLTVCKMLVELQGGTIWGRPRQSRGSEFGFSLPALHED
jgi:PAS domain S-box-containing protein